MKPAVWNLFKFMAPENGRSPVLQFTDIDGKVHRLKSRMKIRAGQEYEGSLMVYSNGRYRLKLTAI